MYRSARTVIFSREINEVIGYNYLTKKTFSCDLDTIEVLQCLDDWVEVSDLAAKFSDVDRHEIEVGISELLAFDAVVEQGSSLHLKEDEFLSTWKWGIPAAMLHFSVEGRNYLSVEDNQRIQKRNLSEVEHPALFQDNCTFAEQIKLRKPDTRKGLLSTIIKRRTNREAKVEEIPLQVIEDALFAGLGIVGFTKSVAGYLPLKTTPSGGARNPFEAYLYVTNVAQLKPGIYHYSAIDHSLGFVNELNSCPAGSALIGGQKWMDNMSCIVLLCAEFDRTMWKYEDPNAYRVVLIEAGHIAQNIMLAVTQYGLTACPSAALDHDAIKDICNLTKISSAPIYALGIGKPVGDEQMFGLKEVAH